jgi:SRSO17 transposase
MASWDEALGEFLKPFVALLGHKKRRQMCPLYVAGLIGPGERKSVQPMAERLDPARYDRFHHFISDGLWDETPIEAELARTADRLVGSEQELLKIVR